jgi:hypothetical protein
MNRESGYGEIKEVRNISTRTVTLFNLDPEVVFHTNDVTLKSSIELLSDDVTKQFFLAFPIQTIFIIEC